MESVIIAAGSNLGDRHSMLKNAGAFLETISEAPVQKSSIWESEPVGPSKYTFLNAAAKITTDAEPLELLFALKEFEQKMGRKKDSPRWSPRILDLDIIAFGRLVIHGESLIIPHPEYSRRRFVLMPMLEITQNWYDPDTQKSLQESLKNAPDMRIDKTNLSW